MTIVSYSFYYPQWQNARAKVMANLAKLNKLPNTRVFVAVENGLVEVLEMVALFLLKTGTFSAKNEDLTPKTQKRRPPENHFKCLKTGISTLDV